VLLENQPLTWLVPSLNTIVHENPFIFVRTDEEVLGGLGQHQ
jgi:hypothetical protein